MEYEDQYRRVHTPKYDCLLFDLDDTLYPLSSGLAASCCKNIEDYMVEKLEIEESKIADMGTTLYKKYGTTLAGLTAIGYKINYDEYHRYVHGRLPYEKLKPDPVLRNLLLSIPVRKLIFTNADKIHAAKVLHRLGLEDCFEGIICFETLNDMNCSNENADCDSEYPNDIFDILAMEPNSDLPVTPVMCKPSKDAFEQAIKIANVDPHRTIFFDDSVRNIQSGKLAGLNTVLVGSSARVKGADFCLENIHNLKEALPALWEGKEKAEKVRYPAGVAIETSVTA
ncbi:unnamed protein product [Victoria cruziana]